MKTKEEIEQSLKCLKDCLADKNLCNPESPITERVIGKVEILQWILESED